MAYSHIPHFFPNTLKILLDMHINLSEQVYLEPEISKASERPQTNVSGIEQDIIYITPIKLAICHFIRKVCDLMKTHLASVIDHWPTFLYSLNKLGIVLPCRP